MIINTLNPDSTKYYDQYVLSHPGASLYHLSGWRKVIEKSYRHRTYIFVAVRDNCRTSADDLRVGPGAVAGVLLLVHIKHPVFANDLLSIPYFDMGGILADDDETRKALLLAAAELGRKLRIRRMEFRQLHPLGFFLGEDPDLLKKLSGMGFSPSTSSNKVRMVLELPDSPETLMRSFKSKLRSQIRKPEREGLYSRIGGGELLDDFYDVFLVNMRDLGSPVHSKAVMERSLAEFGDTARIIIVYKEKKPLAGSLIIGFRDTLENPWASSLREYSRLSPNMMLYWSMLEYACENGYRFFDFGRSTPEEGTYRFKAQWGAKPSPLYWHLISREDKPLKDVTGPDKGNFERAIRYWKKLPVSLTKIIGPIIRKYIGL